MCLKNMHIKKDIELTKVVIRDNEKPPRTVHVHSFEAQARPITNEEVSENFETT